MIVYFIIMVIGFSFIGFLVGFHWGVQNCLKKNLTEKEESYTPEQALDLTSKIEDENLEYLKSLNNGRK